MFTNCHICVLLILYNIAKKNSNIRIHVTVQSNLYNTILNVLYQFSQWYTKFLHQFCAYCIIKVYLYSNFVLHVKNIS